MISTVRASWNRVRSFFRKEALDQDLEAEMRAHLELAVAENVRSGMSLHEAQHQALVRFGGVTQAKERQREARGLPWLDILMQDLRFTMRTLRRDRVFAVIAVVILALGIGANVAVFSVVNTILLRQLPFHDPQQLVWLSANNGVGGLSARTFSVDAYEQFRQRNHAFQDVTAYNPFYGSSPYKLTGRGEAQDVSGVMVAGNFFSLLGVEPELGRLFTPDECVKGGRPAVLLSHAYWKRQFAGNRSIVGQTITLNKQAVTVVGVLPAWFDFGSVFQPGLKMDIFTPGIMDDMLEWGNTLTMLGRLKPGATVSQAQAEADLLGPHLVFSLKHPEWNPDGYQLKLEFLKDYISGRLRRSLIVLWCAVGAILLIVCVNLSNLLLARTAARSKEFAMRSALGAGRGRLVRQLLTESFVLSGAGAAIGVGLAFAITYYLAHQGSIALPLLSSARVDGTALAWTLLIATTAAVLFGLVPGLKISGGNVQEGLKEGGRGTSEGRKHDRLRTTLVISEIALACVLLVGAGLLLRSFLRVLDVELGFEPSHAAALKIDYDDGGDLAKRGAILHDMLQRVMAIPGVEAAGISDMLPLDRNRSWGFSPKGKTYAKGEEPGDVFVYIVTPGYLRAMGMHLLDGRDLSWQDAPKGQEVVVINQAAARYYWPGENALGKLAVGVGKGDTQVVGIVADVRESGLEDESKPQVYLPITQFEPEGAELVIRTKLPPEQLAGSVMSTLRAVNPGQPVTEFRPIQQLVDHAVSPRRFFVLLVTPFAALGLFLASLGIYGVISYAVTRQKLEIGIRMALGASRGRVQYGVISRTLRMALIGIVAGSVYRSALHERSPLCSMKPDPSIQ